MINHALKEMAVLSTRGFAVKFIGNAPGKCPACDIRAIVDFYDDDMRAGKPTLKLVYECDAGYYGCGKKFLRDDERISQQENLVVWEIKHPGDEVGGHLNVCREVLAALCHLNDAELEDWYFQWANGAIVDSLEKAELEPAPSTSDCVHCHKPLTFLDQPTDPPLHDKCRKPYAVFGETTTTKKEKQNVDSTTRRSQPARNTKTAPRRTASDGNGSKTKVAGSARKNSNPSGSGRKNPVGGKRAAGPRKSDPLHDQRGKGTRSSKPSASR